MTKTEEAIRDFCGYHADWWPSTSQVQEMMSLAQPCKTCEALARTVMLDQTSHDSTPPQRQWVDLTDERVKEIWLKGKDHGDDWLDVLALARSFEAELKELNT